MSVRRKRTAPPRAAQPARETSDRANPRTPRYVAFLAAVVVATYANSLPGAFVLDDQASIVQNPGIRTLRTALMPMPDSPVAGRPLVSLSFAINYALGGLDPRGYRVVNLSVHLVCALLIFAIGRRNLPLGVAFAASLVWAVHPLNSEVVNYLSQRTESMMAAFYLATVYAAVRAIDALRPGRWQLVSIVACALGALCKEPIATAPLVVALYDRAFVFDSWRSAIDRRRVLYAGLASTWLIVGAVVASAPRAAVAGFSSGVSPWTYVLNQAVIITEYLRLSVWPDSLVAFYGWPLPLSLADAAPQAAFVLLLLAATIIALFRVPALGFLGAFFFITLAPTSSIIPVATEVGADRRMYLPLIAVTMLAVVGAVQVAARVARRRYMPLAVAALAVVSTALAFTTIARNREYRSQLTLARTIVERRPTSVAHQMLAEQLLEATQTDEAIRHLRDAVAMGNSRASYVLGLALYNEGQYEEAVRQLEAFVQTAHSPVPLVPRWLEPNRSEIAISRVAIGRVHLLRERWTQAADEAGRVLELIPGHLDARLLMADALFGHQQWGGASMHYREYLKAQPNDARALINFGIARVAVEDLDEAIAAFDRAARVDPADARARQLLAMARQDRALLER